MSSAVYLQNVSANSGMEILNIVCSVINVMKECLPLDFIRGGI
jgi:hypothetical protein